MAEELSKLSLFELNRTIKEGIQGVFPDSIWVVAEISDFNTNQSGHCYLELIEKETGSEKIIAKAKANIWSFTFRILKPYFESSTGQRLSVGLKILVKASVEYHELYGLSLNIKDIEPSFTVGDMARRRQEIINRLINEGVFELNKELEFPPLPQRIAIISSESAAGYGDFINQLKNNQRGFKFYPVLFKASMQGNDTEKSVTLAFDQIYQHYEQFDLVVIIRGGGSQAELNYFNNYNIAFHITQFPIPVLAGIGHDRDQTITDLVAHTSLKTPTAVAEYIISSMEETAQHIDYLEDSLINFANNILDASKTRLESIVNAFQSQTKWHVLSNKNKHTLLFSSFQQKLKVLMPNRKAKINQLEYQLESNLKFNLILHRAQIHQLERRLPTSVKTTVKSGKSKLNYLENLVEALSPAQILKRGYSLTYFNGKLVRSISDVTAGAEIETRLMDGKIESNVVKK